MKKILCILSLAIMCALNAHAELITVHGTVLDHADQEPLIGVSVMPQGQKAGVLTGIDGNFSISVQKGAKLTFNYIGYHEVEAVANNTTLTVYMESAASVLNEVVAIGYGVQRRSDITGSISSVSASEISASPVANAIQALEGRAAGVQVTTNTGAPGGSTTIKIRGTGTVNDSDPLYVVDGFIVDNIDHLNPNDIANIEIFKDAASSSIYGARGANGVVVITTKQGQSGKTKVSFDAYVGASQPWKEIKVMGVEDFALMRDYVTSSSNYSSQGKLFHSTDVVTGEISYDEGKYHRIDSIKSNTPASWWDAVTRTGIKQSYNLSVNGGGDKSTYMISGNFYREDGIIRTSDYQRFSLRTNLQNKITNWLTLHTSMLYTNDARSLITEGQSSVLKRALNQNPLVVIYNEKGYWQEDHPLAQLARNHNKAKTDRIDVNIDLTAKLGRLFTYQFKFSNYLNFYNTYKFSEVGKLEEDFVMPDDMTTVTRYSTRSNKTEFNNLLLFHFDNKTHNVDATIGQTIEMHSMSDISASRKGTSSNEDNLQYLSAAYYGDRTSGALTEWNAMGFLGRVSYSYDYRYLLQFNFRADASSKFSHKNRWGYFPSASIGWRFNNEQFMKGLTVLSNGKLRLGWGILGNNRINEYARYTMLTNMLNYSYGTGLHITQPGAAALMLGNDNIKWEKTKTYNIGLDLGFFNNRLNASFDLYDKETSDMLLNVPITVSAGSVTAPMVNAGSVNNKGLETQISWTDRIGSDFRYDIGFNISFNKNKVTGLGQGNEPIYGAYLEEASIVAYVTKTEVGHPIACFFGYVTDGIFQNEEEIQVSSQNDGITKPGDFRFKDLNNDGKIDSDDRTYIGSPHPDFIWGLPINLGYKNFSLSLFLQGQVGNKIFNVMDYYLCSAHGTGNVYSDVRERHWAGDYDATRAYWRPNPTGDIPDLRQADNSKNFRASDFFVKDGSYCRLKDVRLSYSLPKSILSKAKISEASVYVSAYNLLTFTKYNGLDPEVGKNSNSESNNLYLGVDHGNYPQARTYTFGLNLTF